ncbi:Rv3654c family TadE-like protein [Nocardioides humi]|uniref:Putative Flp pilus-assembly TadG-like N-terminal domain-containing protein n=1 Tax=Nocardioides humi TaxID=449461 RepID=A0ABN2AB08_9ACTN|nr:Rv3654c family TadE-like protein [Nocardioides humi]
MSRIAADRGAATVLAVALAGVLLLVGAATGLVGALLVAHRRAQAAADLSALAAATSLAGRVAHPGRDPCTEATDVAAANGAALVSCRIDGREVVVEVRVTGPRWLGQDQDLVAAARAGPG